MQDDDNNFFILMVVFARKSIPHNVRKASQCMCNLFISIITKIIYNGAIGMNTFEFVTYMMVASSLQPLHDGLNVQENVNFVSSMDCNDIIAL